MVLTPESSDDAEDTLPLVKGVADSTDDQQKRRSTLLALVLLALLGLFALNEITKSGPAGRSGSQLSSDVIESASAYDVAPAHGEQGEAVDSRSFRNEKKIVVLLSSGRDAESCARVIVAARDLAFRSNRIYFRVHEEIVVNHEDSCLQVLCNLRPRDCKVLLRSKHLQVTRRDVSGALGASVALHVLEGMVDPNAFVDDFYLSVDANIEFTKHWDLALLKQWYSIGNNRAILTVAPPAVETKGMNKGIFFLQCSARIHSKDKDPVVEFNPPEPKPLPTGNGVAGALVATFPVLQAQYSERFHFGLVSSLLSVRSDPYLHQLVVGYEYMRATRFWTKGFDFYAPMQDILYYRYEQPLAPHEKGESNSVIDSSSRRIRRLLGLPLSSPLWEHEATPESELYGPGSNRSLEAWREFSGINDSDHLNESTTNHFAANCERALHYVHFD